MEIRSVFSLVFGVMGAWWRVRLARLRHATLLFRAQCQGCRGVGAWAHTKAEAEAWARCGGWRPASPLKREWYCPICCGHRAFCASCEDSAPLALDQLTAWGWRSATMDGRRAWICWACLADPAHSSWRDPCPVCRAPCERPSPTGCERCGDGDACQHDPHEVCSLCPTGVQ